MAVRNVLEVRGVAVGSNVSRRVGAGESVGLVVRLGLGDGCPRQSVEPTAQVMHDSVFPMEYVPEGHESQLDPS
jgi:hypothetical protein